MRRFEMLANQIGRGRVQGVPCGTSANEAVCGYIEVRAMAAALAHRRRANSQLPRLGLIICGHMCYNGIVIRRRRTEKDNSDGRGRAFPLSVAFSPTTSPLMEQLREFVAKSFVDGKAAPVVQAEVKDSLPVSSAPINAAHMISNILSTMPQMSAASTHWPLSYPFPLFASQPELSAFHSKMAINSVVEKFSELQHKLNQSHHLHYPASMLYSHKTATFPFFVHEGSTFLAHDQAREIGDKNDPTHVETSVNDAGESFFSIANATIHYANGRLRKVVT